MRETLEQAAAKLLTEPVGTETKSPAMALTGVLGATTLPVGAVPTKATAVVPVMPWVTVPRVAPRGPSEGVLAVLVNVAPPTKVCNSASVNPG